MTESERQNLPSFWELTADKLDRHPELLANARDNCARWLRENHSGPHWLCKWDTLLADAEESDNGRAKMREVMLGGDDASIRMREFHPMAGILTRRSGGGPANYAAIGIKTPGGKCASS